jgi:uncharacterized protein
VGLRLALLLLLLSGLVGPAATAGADALPNAEPIEPGVAARLEQVRAAQREPRTRHRDAAGRARFVNRLALQASPYLLQHAHNPVNWYPWGDEAFAEARRLKRPVFLSVGYSTCHWCHVMEEESFEDLEIAGYLNTHFVAIKVDREERPDIDAVYMAAVQAVSGNGGWPMTVFLAEDRRPFFGGTYFPPRDDPARGGMGFLSLLRRVVTVWGGERQALAESLDQLEQALKRSLAPAPTLGALDARPIRTALAQVAERFDEKNGGLGQGQKFPSSLPLRLLLRAGRRTGETRPRQMVQATLDAMARGGIRDHVAGGFHRYTVEPTWTVPHFEKMLYDNAMLADAYLDGAQALGDPRLTAVARDVLEYVAREMTSPQGTFYSATDADSEGEEGRYFVWTRAELEEAAGKDLARLAALAYGASGEPNFEKRAFVLRRDASPAELAKQLGLAEVDVEIRLAGLRGRLLAARAKRTPPLRDEKQLVAWNGLMISAFARAGLALGDPALVERGARAARTLLDQARPKGVLARYLLNGVPHGRGLLDDHAFLEAGLLDLFEATGEARWLDAAQSLQAALDARFQDAGVGGYFTTPVDGEVLLVRAKPAADEAQPSANAVAAQNLLRLHHLTGDERARERAEQSVRVFGAEIARLPYAHAGLLEALDFLLDEPREIVVVTPGDRAAAEPFLRELAQVFLPNRLLIALPESAVPALEKRLPVLEGKRALNGRTTAFVCVRRACQLPAQTPEQFAKQLRSKPLPYPEPAPR